MITMLKRFVTVTLCLAILLSFAIPIAALKTSAVEERASKRCSMCSTTITSPIESDKWVTVRRSCTNTEATGCVHEHYLLYKLVRWLCPKCGYEEARSETFVREYCSVALRSAGRHDLLAHIINSLMEKENG